MARLCRPAFTCADPTGPGIASCTDSNSASSPGALNTTAGGSFTYTVTATSADGQTGTATIAYTVAGGPTATITTPTTGHTYAVGQVVPTAFTCADPTGPGIASCTDSNSSNSPGALNTGTKGTFAYTVTATSSDGQTGTATITYTVAGGPTATITAPTTGHTYAVGQVVPTAFTCADATGPGIASCTDSNSSASPGALATTAKGTFTYTVTATSTDGQTGTATIGYTVAGAPTATITTPTTGHTYAVGQVVPTAFTCADPTGPGIATCTDSNASTSPGALNTTAIGTFTYTVTATSSDGQTGTATIGYTVAAAPAATITAPTTGHTYTVNQVVPTGFSCADPTGPGIATCTDSNASTSPGGLNTTAIGTFTYTVTATSKDGQTGTVTIGYTVAGGPTATIVSPATGHTYAVGQVVPTAFTCADPGPGIATCTDSNSSASPGALDTSASGTFIYTVTATSTDGQTGTATIAYTVAGGPTATITAPTTGHTYTVGQVVPTAFTCADPTGPGIATCTDSNSSASPGALHTGTTGSFTYTVTATSTDGQTGTATINFKVAGIPTATIVSPASGHTYAVGQVVPTSFSCADPTGPGVATCTDSNSSASPGALNTGTEGSFTYTVTATSTDGQTGTASITYTVAGAPTANITTPTTGHTYAVGQVVPTSFTCADPGPGIATCTDSNSASSPGALNTSASGSFTYTVTAISTDGQTGTATIAYTVAGVPTATIVSPASGQTYAVGQVVPTGVHLRGSDGARHRHVHRLEHLEPHPGRSTPGRQAPSRTR